MVWNYGCPLVLWYKFNDHIISWQVALNIDDCTTITILKNDSDLQKLFHK